MSVETIARRYASALADVVEKTGEEDAVKGELKSWEDMIRSNTDLYTAFANPSIAHRRKENVLESLLPRTTPSKTTANFLRVLLRNSRLIDLPAINDKFVSVIEERRGIVNAKASSAHELSDEEKRELKSNLEKITGKSVYLTYEIDPELIGGVVTRVGSIVYDGSVRTQLENLREQLMQK
jgi:F-type H+-transporting ATPase subunit delta